MDRSPINASSSSSSREKGGRGGCGQGAGGDETTCSTAVQQLGAAIAVGSFGTNEAERCRGVRLQSPAFSASSRSTSWVLHRGRLWPDSVSPWSMPLRPKRIVLFPQLPPSPLDPCRVERRSFVVQHLHCASCSPVGGTSSAAGFGRLHRGLPPGSNARKRVRRGYEVRQTVRISTPVGRSHPILYATPVHLIGG